MVYVILAGVVVVALVAAFVFGVLFGRKNARLVQAAVNAPGDVAKAAKGVAQVGKDLGAGLKR